MIDAAQPHPSSPDKPHPTAKRVRAHQSLQQVLLVVVLFSIAVPALISGGVLIMQSFQRAVEGDSQQTAENYIELLQAGMTLPLWNISPGLGQPLMDVIQFNESVLSILVKTSSDAVFLSYNKSGQSPEEDSIAISREIIYEGDVLGEVSLVYSIKEARNRALKESQLVLVIIFFQLVCSLALMAFFLRKRVTMPLFQLENSAARIADGDLETQIPEFGNDEFGALSNQLERMRWAMSRSIHDLETRVRERTGELLTVNGELQGALDKLKRAQKELVQQEKLAALGSLVAGIAHELNTPIGNGLTVASSLSEATDHLMEALDTGMTRSMLEHYLTDMKEGTHLVCVSLEKASELVSSFKQVAVDRASAQRRSFQLSNLLNETRVTMSTLMKHSPFKLEIYHNNDVTLDSYPGPLGQVITNLLNNALLHGFDHREAGKIVIRSTIIDEGVQIEVEDNGIGIDPDAISHIFDPFFTTKLGEGGNGLGLHIVHNIVTAALGGTIEVDSALGRGTRFILKIPLVAPDEKFGLSAMSSQPRTKITKID